MLHPTRNRKCHNNNQVCLWYNDGLMHVNIPKGNVSSYHYHMCNGLCGPLWSITWPPRVNKSWPNGRWRWHAVSVMSTQHAPVGRHCGVTYMASHHYFLLSLYADGEHPSKKHRKFVFFKYSIFNVATTSNALKKNLIENQWSII